MKKCLLPLLIFFAVVSNTAFAQSAGFNNTFIILSIDGSLDLYYDLNATTENYDFDGESLGTFCQNDTDGLIFKGGEHNIYKCGTCDLTSTRIYYRIYPTGSPSGSFISNTLNYSSGFNNGCGGQDQRWERLDFNTNLLSGLGAGNYTLEVYSDASVTCGSGTIYAGNNGNNYKANFTVSATTVGGTITGNDSFCSVSNSGALTLSGHTGNVLRWESSTVADFSSAVTQITNTTTSLSLSNIEETAYYRAVVKSGECAEESSAIHTVTINPNSWTGNESSDWNNALNWCGGVPVTGDAVTIAATDNQPVISSGDAPEVESISIGSGASLTISSGGNLTITNAVSVAEEGTFTVEDNANLIQVNDVANTGTILVQKNSSPLYRLDYTLWSSPVTGQNLEDFSPSTLTNRFYTYDEATDTYSQITPSENDFIPGIGYLIRMPNNHPAYSSNDIPGTVWTGTFMGVPNNGTITVATTNGLNGYNLTGNPYPSPINIHDFFDANTGAIDQSSALYFWRKRNDPNSSTYATITKAAYTANAASGGDLGSGGFTGESSDWVINPGQGFFVQANGNDIVFNNTMRRAVNNSQFFRASEENETLPISRLWLNISGENNEFKQAAIAYSDQATLGLDYGWDGKAFTTDGPVAIYTTVENVDLGIQARPAFTVSDIIPFIYKVTNAGNYIITLDHFDGVFSQGQDIYLKDNQLLTITNLKESNYHFITEAGVYADRFEIVYQPQALIGNTHVRHAENVTISQKDGVIAINSNSGNLTDIAIYDVTGKLLYKSENLKDDKKLIYQLQPKQQLLLVTITTENARVTKKILF